MNKRYLIPLLLCLILLAGCKTGKKAMEGGPGATGERLVRKEKDRSAFFQAVKTADTDFAWFSARGKASIATGSRDYNVTLHL
ncbi:MAG TPA: hypothetical protein VD772_12730, partial [Anseongella sp.]|nr:hypothetical protein [Anseongella sp.]